MNGKQFTLSTLSALILLTVALAPTSSQQEVREYDPWFDINDDGKIDIKDIASIAMKFGTTGAPVNKTALLLSLNESVAELQSKMWYKTSYSVITGDQWNWNWTVHETAHGGPPYLLYKKEGDTVFMTFPSGSLIVCARVEQSTTYWSKWAGTTMGGPYGSQMLMSSANLTATFTAEDIPLTDEDNNYNGTRILFEHWQDLYGLVNIGGDNYVWQGFAHQHFVSWAPEGSPT